MISPSPKKHQLLFVLRINKYCVAYRYLNIGTSTASRLCTCWRFLTAIRYLIFQHRNLILLWNISNKIYLMDKCPTIKSMAKICFQNVFSTVCTYSVVYFNKSLIENTWIPHITAISWHFVSLWLDFKRCL